MLIFVTYIIQYIVDIKVQQTFLFVVHLGMLVINISVITHTFKRLDDVNICWNIRGQFVQNTTLIKQKQ